MLGAPSRLRNTKPLKVVAIVAGSIVVILVALAVALAVAASNTTVDGPGDDVKAPTTGVLSRPCAVLDGTAIVGASNGEALVSDIGSSCQYEPVGRTVQVTIQAVGASVEELLGRADCQKLDIPGGRVCAFSHPLGEEGTGSALVVKSAKRSATLSVVGQALSPADLNEAAQKLAGAIA